jgi:hypothetical protein
MGRLRDLPLIQPQRQGSLAFLILSSTSIITVLPFLEVCLKMEGVL